MVDAEIVRQILDYNPDTGEFCWKARTPEMFVAGKHSSQRKCRAWNAKNTGNIAGTSGGDGYLQISINSRRYQAHRIAWLWMVGEMPRKEIDHIDCDRSNNRFANLREATHAQNNRNTPKQSNNSSGYKGVFLDRNLGKWRARIYVNGDCQYLGCFGALEDAAAAYAKAAHELHGEFARTE